MEGDGILSFKVQRCCLNTFTAYFSFNINQCETVFCFFVSIDDLIPCPYTFVYGYHLCVSTFSKFSRYRRFCGSLIYRQMSTHKYTTLKDKTLSAGNSSLKNRECAYLTWAVSCTNLSEFNFVVRIGDDMASYEFFAVFGRQLEMTFFIVCWLFCRPAAHLPPFLCIIIIYFIFYLPQLHLMWLWAAYL